MAVSRLAHPLPRSGMFASYATLDLWLILKGFFLVEHGGDQYFDRPRTHHVPRTRHRDSADEFEQEDNNPCLLWRTIIVRTCRASI